MALMEGKKMGVRILLGIFVALIGGSMLLYLVPQMPGTNEAASTDTVAKVGNINITVSDVRRQLDDIQQRNPIPKPLESIYAQQILKQLVFQKELEYEAQRLNISVSNQEVADRIRQFLPTAYNGDTPIAMDQYAAQVQSRFNLTVPAFEELVRQGLLEEKFRRRVTDGVSVGPDELQQEFRYRNEKVKLDYALIKPSDLESKVSVSDADVKTYYDKNKSKYPVPERRVVRYGLVDINQLRQAVQISDDQLKQEYQQNIAQYQVPNRVHVEHILFKTVGETDAEVAEAEKKAEAVLKQAKSGANFQDLAKKYSQDDGTKDKGGDLGWIVQGQTVPEFEKAAFGLPKGSISDLVKTQYGFHIIKVLDKEQAHTKPFDEVKDSILAPLRLSQADSEANSTADKLSNAIRQNGNITLDALAKQFHLSVAETRPVAANEPILELGNSPDIKDTIFRLRPGEVSMPIQTDRGYVVLSVKEIQQAHQGSLDEVRDRVLLDVQKEKATEAAKSKAEELAKRVKGGEKFAAAAKALGVDAKTSDFFSRNGSVPDVGSGKQLSAAFNMKAGEVAAPSTLGANWLVYEVADKQAPNPDDFDKQKKELVEQALQTKRGLAFDAFRTALDNRLKQEGKLQIMTDKLKSFGSFT